jgi:hypothetical protein
MRSFSVYFLRTTKIETSQQRFGSLKALPDCPWIQAAFCPDDYPPDDPILLGEETLAVTPSATLGEVIFLYGDTRDDWFIYEHARDGHLLRKLVWCPLLDDDWNAGWVVVEGEPEPWETQLFSPHGLTGCIEREELEPALQAQWQAELEAAWASQTLTQGKTYPPCDGTVVWMVQDFYGIPRTAAPAS